MHPGNFQVSVMSKHSGFAVNLLAWAKHCRGATKMSHISFAWSQESTWESTWSHQHSSGHICSMFGTNVWILTFFLKRLILGIFSGSQCCLVLPCLCLCFESQLDSWNDATPEGTVHQRVITFLGTFREINLKSNSCRLQRKRVQTKTSWHLWRDWVGNFFYFLFFLPKSLRTHKWKVLPLQYITLHKCVLGCNHCRAPWVQTPSRQDFYSQCFCQSSWTSELLLFNYRWILATLRQWAFTIAREVIAFYF